MACKLTGSASIADNDAVSDLWESSCLALIHVCHAGIAAKRRGFDSCKRSGHGNGCAYLLQVNTLPFDAVQIDMLKTEITFERYLKEQHIQRIRRLRRENIKIQAFQMEHTSMVC